MKFKQVFRITGQLRHDLRTLLLSCRRHVLRPIPDRGHDPCASDEWVVQYIKSPYMFLLVSQILLLIWACSWT